MARSVEIVARVAVAILTLATAGRAGAMCGCDKPPPPLANVRPFAAHPEQQVALFDERLVEGAKYTVVFTARDGSMDWSRARAVVKKDFADRVAKPQLRVAVPDVPLGPTVVSVFGPDDKLVYTLSENELTVIAPPISIHDFKESISRDGYQTGVGTDGTLYIAFDATDMSDATTYVGTAEGLGLRFDSDHVLIYNGQGFFGGWLDPNNQGLFRIMPGTNGVSDTLAYWRHEFRTYKEEHRKRDARRTSDGEWHADGTPHVDNFHFVLAVQATLDGKPLAPGATPPFRLKITAAPAPASPL